MGTWTLRVRVLNGIAIKLPHPKIDRALVDSSRGIFPPTLTVLNCDYSRGYYNPFKGLLEEALNPKP